MSKDRACEAKLAVGGGKKAKRRGHGVAKWFCYRCGITGWFDQNLRDVCNEANRKPDAVSSAPEVIGRGNAP